MRIWKRLLGTALCLCAAVCLMSVSASAAEHSGHPICGAAHTDIGDHTGTCNDVTWIEVTQADVTDNNGELKLEAGQSYYLGEDIEVKWEITINGTVNLCLNGHSIVRTNANTNTNFTNAVIDVSDVTTQTHFTLCDCKGGGTITHKSGIPGQGVNASADFTMYGGKISGNHAGTDQLGEDGAGVAVGGTFTMYGGTITDNHVEKRLNYGGGGVVVSGRGKFIMYDGEISHNTSNADGGGVAVVASSFQMYGGTISGNSATGVGGGVSLWNRAFTLSGGTISGNTAKEDGGGVYFSGYTNSNILTISDTMKIEGNSAANGGGVYIKSYNLKMTGGSIINNNATDSGGGVYFTGSSFNVSGNVSITGNKKGATSTGSGLNGGTDNNVYLPNGKIITVAGALTGSNQIGVTTENTPNNSKYVQIASGNASNAKPEKFRYENDGAIAVSAVSGSTTKLVACKHNWSSEWTADTYQHWHVCSICKGKNDPVAHTYDQKVAEGSYKAFDATCVSPALYYWSCVCGAEGTDTFESGETNPTSHTGALGDWQSDENNHWKEYSCCQVRANEGNHQWDEGRETKSPTCTAPGEKTYTCSVCSATRTETVSATGHSWADAWMHDDTHHWHNCENANCPVTENSGKSGYAEHSGGTATCQAKAVCETCGQAYGELKEHPWADATCTEPKTCPVCQTVEGTALGHDFESGTWQSDGDHHWKKCSRCDVTDEANKAPHSGGTATCIAKAECVTCGTAYGALDANNHIGVLGVWQSNEDKHWKEYSCCQVHANEGNHQWDEGRETKSPTCTEDGVKTFTCSQCNNTKTEPISALGHDFENGTWQSDGDHHWKKCSRCDVTDTKTAHRWNEGRETKSPTCTAAGEKTYTCTDCGRTKTEQIDALGHDWGEWVVTKPATTSAAGEEKRVCQRNTSHTETRDIPKLTPAPSGGGSSSAPAVTVPVSGSGDTVHVSASVSGSTAEVKEIKSAELDKIGTDSAVVIDLSGLNKGVTGVTLSTDTIDSICKTEADGVTIKLPNAELRVDRQTLAAVTEQAAGSKLRLVVEPDGTARSTMTAAQKSALAGMKNAAALEAYFVSGDKRIHDFKGGSVELSIPYRADGAIRAWFLKEDGTREPVSARYDKENALLILHHFSHYVIEELDSSAAYTVCAKDDSCPIWLFADAVPTAWYHDGVHYCIENGLMQGVSTASFLPNGSTTRAQLVTILWRLEGNPAPVSAAGFSDVADGAWYAVAVRWAAGCGVVKGYDNGCFGPNDAVTREQMVTILYRYAQYKGYDVSIGEDTNILSFNDALTVSGYSIPAMQWACGSGLMTGAQRDGGMALAPRDTTTRAQTATLLMRFQSAFAKEP